ncbi:MAG: hypothetical protein ACETVR_03115 [Candidatus Bathyarchaeia archaeon]
MDEEVKVLKSGNFNRIRMFSRVGGRSRRRTIRDATITVTENGVSFKGVQLRERTPVETQIDFRGILNFILETYEGRDGNPVYRIRVNRFIFWTMDKSWFDVIDGKVQALGNLRRREVIEYRPTRYTIPKIIESIRAP